MIDTVSFSMDRCRQSTEKQELMQENDLHYMIVDERVKLRSLAAVTFLLFSVDNNESDVISDYGFIGYSE